MRKGILLVVVAIVTVLSAGPAFCQEPSFLHIVDMGYAEIASLSMDNPEGELWDGALSASYTGLLNVVSGNMHWLGPRVSYVNYALDWGNRCVREVGNARHVEIAAVYRIMPAGPRMIVPFVETGIGVSVRRINVRTSIVGVLIADESIDDAQPVYNLGGGVVLGGGSKFRGEIRANWRTVYTGSITDEDTGVEHLSLSFGIVIGL